MNTQALFNLQVGNEIIDIFGIPGYLKFILHSLNNSVQEYYNIYFKLVINK